MNPVIIASLIIGLCSFSVASAAEESCRTAQSCGDCLERESCGWCSGKLRRLNGTWLVESCFRDVDYGAEVLCFEMLSITKCEVGFLCNPTTGKCEETAPGTGNTFGHCAGTCNCSAKGCDRFSCSGGTNDMFYCEFDPENGTQTLTQCSDICGVSSATPIPTPGNCTPACTVACDPLNAKCCPHSHCSYDFVWNDYRCHPDGKFC